MADEPVTPAVDLDALADKLLERMRPAVAKQDYELVAFQIVGSELRATVKAPSGESFQGVVTNWEKVKVVEVKK